MYKQHKVNKNGCNLDLDRAHLIYTKEAVKTSPTANNNHFTYPLFPDTFFLTFSLP